MPQNPEPGSHDEIRTVRALGHDLRVSIRPGTDPAARPLLMLMGLGGNIEMWEPLRSALTERVGMTTVAFDVPGTGESPPALFPLPLPGVALLTSRLLRILEFDHVDVLGLSWGGLLAQQLALTAPGQVHRLVLASTSVGLGSIPGDWSALRTLATPARYHSMQQLGDALDVFGGNADYAGDAMHIHNQARLARPPSIYGYYSQLASLAGWTSLPWLPLIRQPTLVLCGSADRAVPMINSRLLAALLGHAELAILRGGGHLVLFEQLAASVNLLAKFLGTPPDGSKPQALGRPETSQCLPGCRSFFAGHRAHPGRCGGRGLPGAGGARYPGRAQRPVPAGSRHQLSTADLDLRCVPCPRLPAGAELRGARRPVRP